MVRSVRRALLVASVASRPRRRGGGAGDPAPAGQPPVGQAPSGRAPARIVSTSPSITETLFALGLGDRVVGVSTFCRFPAEVATLPKVGTFLKPDAELIARLGRIWSSSTLARTRRRRSSRRSASAPWSSNAARCRACSRRSGQIGAAAGVPDRASSWSRTSPPSLDRVRAAVAGASAAQVLFIVGRRPGTLTDLVARRTRLLPERHRRDCGRHQRAGLGDAGVPADLDGDGPRPRSDVIVDIGDMGETPADSDRRRAVTDRLWQRQTLVTAVRTGGVHATTTRPSSCRDRGSSTSPDDGAMAARSRARGERRRCCACRTSAGAPPAPVLEHVSFDVAPGEFVAVVGRNGAGKSTLLDIVAGLRTPAAGDVTLAGRPLAAWTPTDRARLVAHLPQIVRADLSTSRGSPGADGALSACRAVVPRKPVRRSVRVGRGPSNRACGDGSGAAAWSSAGASVADAQRRRAAARAASPPASRSSRSCCSSTSRRPTWTSTSSCTASRCCARKPTAASPASRSRTI